MHDPNDPKLLEALQRIFTTREELRQIVAYQQQLFDSLQRMLTSQTTMHDHVSKLTDSHNRIQGDTATLVRVRPEIERAIRDLDTSHRQTQSEMRRAIDAIAYVQQEIRKISAIETQLASLQRAVEVLQNGQPGENQNQLRVHHQ